MSDKVYTMDDDYFVDLDEEWRDLVCTDDILTEQEYREYLAAWWGYESKED